MLNRHISHRYDDLVETHFSFMINCLGASAYVLAKGSDMLPEGYGTSEWYAWGRY